MTNNLFESPIHELATDLDLLVPACQSIKKRDELGTWNEDDKVALWEIAGKYIRDFDDMADSFVIHIVEDMVKQAATYRIAEVDT
jgi:hypothetical protein